MVEKKKKEILTFRQVLQEMHAGISCGKAEFTVQSMGQTDTNSSDSFTTLSGFELGQGVSVSKIQFAAFKLHLRKIEVMNG